MRQARAEAMKATLDGINRDLEKYGGGSWEKWGEANRAYREAVSKLLTAEIKWPWPAKHGFVFQGSAIKLLLEDTLDKRPDGERPFDAIAAFDKQLRALGIDLIFVPLPDKGLHLRRLPGDRRQHAAQGAAVHGGQAPDEAPPGGRRGGGGRVHAVAGVPGEAR